MTQPKLARYWNDAEAQGRGYVRPSTGERVPGITSITKLIDKDLSQWGADQAVRWMANHWFEWNPGGKSEESAFRHARYRHKDYRDERGEVGTGVHTFLEQHLRGEEPLIEFLDREQQEMVEQFHEFVFLSGATFQGQEATVWGGDWAGTLDGYMTLNGKTGIVDYKTSKAIYPEVMMQLSGLKSAKVLIREVPEGTPDAHILEDKQRGNSWWVEEEAPQVDTAWILHLRGSFHDVDLVVPAKWELIELDNEGLHLARFDSLKAQWYANKALKDAGVDLRRKLSS